MYLIMVPGILVCCIILSINMCMFIVLKALLRSSAMKTVWWGRHLWLKPLPVIIIDFVES